jgi:hypothetical protein
VRQTPQTPQTPIDRRYLAGLLGLAAVLAAAGCDDGSNAAPPDGGSGAAGGVVVSPLVVSTATRTPRTTTWSVNYWMWSPTYGDQLPGTEPLVAALKPAVMRVGGYNNDANTPDPFDNAQLDTAVAYARAIGAEPLIQVPHLADTSGNPPTADEAAAMVTYANVTMQYGIKYFSIGNEPDIYDAQGSLTDITMPAIPGYTPADYCASVETYVAAMKAVDPTIQIVGPDLAYKYQAGDATNDWLTPILQQCGDLFDIVSIHRYPFEAAQASLTAAEADPASFRDVIKSVRGILTATGTSDKPLALTEMNIVYDATTCVLDASPGTVGSALWMADSLGSAIELGLWTSAVWDISDPDNYQLGLIGLPPAHTPRPEYYAYALYADHFGPTWLNVTSAPAGVSAHASRNQADDATEIIAINWNSSAVGLAFQITGLATAPASTTYYLPPVSMAAVEIPDSASPSAWIYGEAQRQAAAAPQPLMPGVVASTGAGGAGGAGAGVAVGAGCGDAAVGCSDIVLPTPAITTLGTASGSTLTYGSGTDKWSSYTYAATGQTPPGVAVTSDGNGLQITAGLVPPVDASTNYLGVGLYFSSSSCVNASAYTGVQFDFSGDLGGCALAFAASFSGDLSHASDATRGTCSASTCYGPSLAVVPSGATATIKVPFASLTAGMPVATLDPSSIVSVQWQLNGPAATADGGGCSANFAVANVAFY